MHVASEKHRHDVLERELTLGDIPASSGHPRARPAGGDARPEINGPSRPAG